MKKITMVLLAVIFMLMLCACGEQGGTGSSSAGVSSAEVSSAESAADKGAGTAPSIGGIPFGQTPQELLASLKEKGISLGDCREEFKDALASSPDGADDGRTYISEEGSGLTAFAYCTENGDIFFKFSHTGKEAAVYTRTPAYSTDKGIKVGDTVSDMEQAYGSDYYSESSGGGRYYSYQQGGAFVYFVTDGGDEISSVYISLSDLPFAD